MTGVETSNTNTDTIIEIQNEPHAHGGQIGGVGMISQRQIMTKGLQTVTSICQDTIEVPYTRPNIAQFAERIHTY